jgi:hypothetical protein
MGEVVSETPERYCANPPCSKRLERKVWSSGGRESTGQFRSRRYCSRTCLSAHRSPGGPHCLANRHGRVCGQQPAQVSALRLTCEDTEILLPLRLCAACTRVVQRAVGDYQRQAAL